MADTDASEPKLRYSDAELLRIVADERRQSIGFGDGDSGELTASRDKALAYAKGEMADVPALKGRSQVVDTAIADAVETVLPDLMEVFAGGEDIATFIPNGEDDEDAAREETDFINHVVNVENPGFLNNYTAFKDALLTRTGIYHWWWEDKEKTNALPPVAADQAPHVQAVAAQMGQELDAEEGEEGQVNLSYTTLHGKICIRSFPSEDFTVAQDTVVLRDATYCAVRDRPRVQDLIARGIDKEKARALQTYSLRNNTVELERDHAGEHNRPVDGSLGDLRIVEVRDHYIKLGDDDGDMQIWRVTTDAEERVLLDKAPVDHIPFAALTPYIVPHRFYGESVADKLFEIQKIKTTLLRMLLDSGYFALNQRMEVAESGSNEFTIADLLDNTPGRPVRVKTPGSVTGIAAGALNFDVFSAMEFVSTLAEQRSGIVRNAQGLNPDTLHDTASGAMALITAAQKRVRLIARIFAETGVKDLYLGVHQLARASYSDKHAPMKAKLGKAWKAVQPNQWQERGEMEVHVGVGSAGREHDLMVANQRLQLAKELIQLPGAQGTLIDGTNIHQQLNAWERAAGTKNPDQYWTDPQSPQAQQAAQAQAQQPNPAQQEMQAKLQLQQQQMQMQGQLDQKKAQDDMALRTAQANADLQLERERTAADQQAAEAQAQRDHELAMTKAANELMLAREKMAAEIQLKREQLAAELQMKHELGMMQVHSQHAQGMAKAEAQADSQVHVGGEPG